MVFNNGKIFINIWVKILKLENLLFCLKKRLKTKFLFAKIQLNQNFHLKHSTYDKLI